MHNGMLTSARQLCCCLQDSGDTVPHSGLLSTAPFSRQACLACSIMMASDEPVWDSGFQALPEGTSFWPAQCSIHTCAEFMVWCAVPRHSVSLGQRTMTAQWTLAVEQGRGFEGCAAHNSECQQADHAGKPAACSATQI